MSLRSALVRSVLTMSIATAISPRPSAILRQWPGTPPPLVFTQVAVERSTGAVASGLTRSDFQVFSDGQPQPIMYFSGDDQPLTLVLLIDVSSSLTSRIGSNVMRAMFTQTFLPGIRPGDRLRAGGICGRFSLGPPFASDRKTLVESINAAMSPADADRFGPSPIWDAVEAAVTALQVEPGRRAILMLTDGRSTGNRSGFGEVAAHAVAAGVMVNIVGKDTQEMVIQDGGVVLRGDAEVNLKALTDLTGGIFRSDNRVRVGPSRAVDGAVLPDRPSDTSVGRLLAREMTELHQLYTIGFLPNARDGKTHTLAVQTVAPDLTVRARRAYVADR